MSSTGSCLDENASGSAFFVTATGLGAALATDFFTLKKDHNKYQFVAMITSAKVVKILQCILERLLGSNSHHRFLQFILSLFSSSLVG